MFKRSVSPAAAAGETRGDGRACFQAMHVYTCPQPPTLPNHHHPAVGCWSAGRPVAQVGHYAPDSE